MPAGDQPEPARLLYSTPHGEAFVGDSLQGMREHLADESVQLFMTSPPFALRRKKEYGNKPADEYIAWFKEFAEVFWDKLKPDGSLVIDLGGSWNPGQPTRSLYQFELLIELCKHMGEKTFHLAQEFYWYNPAKMPSPAQWVTVERVRVKDSVNVVWWLSKSPNPKASNRRVLKPYSRAMEKLHKRGSYNSGKRPGQQRVSKEAWAKEQGGAIPANAFDLPFDPLQDEDNLDAALAEATEDSVNWLEIANTDSVSRYHRVLRQLEKATPPEDLPALRECIRAHPARFPLDLPAFFIDFLTDDQGDLVVDPFAGSNVTGEAAERAERAWVAFEMHQPYLEGSVARFDAFETGDILWHGQQESVLDLSAKS